MIILPKLGGVVADRLIPIKLLDFTKVFENQNSKRKL